MRPEQIRDLLRRQPFVPIRLHMSDRKTYDIGHPDLAFLTRSYVEIGIETKRGSRIFDRVMFCSLLHIVRVEELNGKKASA